MHHHVCYRLVRAKSVALSVHPPDCHPHTLSQLHNSIEDCLWVIVLSEAFFCVVALYPRTSLSFKATSSPLLQMVAFKLVSVDGLRLTSVVSDVRPLSLGAAPR